MVQAGNGAQSLSSVNHATKTIHHTRARTRTHTPRESKSKMVVKGNREEIPLNNS